MRHRISRREVLTRLGTAGAGVLLGRNTAEANAGKSAASRPITIAGRPVELVVTAVSPQTLRLSVVPLLDGGRTEPIADSLVLVRRDWSDASLRTRFAVEPQVIPWGRLRVRVSSEPPVLRVDGKLGKVIQQIEIALDNGAVSFSCSEGPVFGLGEGGPQSTGDGQCIP